MNGRPIFSVQCPVSGREEPRLSLSVLSEHLARDSGNAKAFRSWERRAFVRRANFET